MFALFVKLFFRTTISSLENLPDVEENLKEKICYVGFEALVNYPKDTMRTIYQWLKLQAVDFEPQNLTVRPHESDSYYRFKYQHANYPTIKPLHQHHISPRIEGNYEKFWVVF